MADEIDLANDLIEIEVKRALSKRKAATPQMGSKHCIECGDDMPEARQKLGFKYCVPCATERERRQALFADE
jgi:RNA polymerase-binding transcription factor DksA